MHIYDTLTKKKKVFRPRNKKRVEMFVCGITPYDSPHIGNLRSFLNYDMIANYLRKKGYKLTYIQNITDIDDKIIKKAQEENTTCKKISEKYFSELKQILKKLNINSVDKYAKATDYIDQIIKQIEVLIKKGYAYQSGGDVFFDVTKFKEYGKLSGQKLSKLKKAKRTEEDKNKKHPYDFALWKAKKIREPFWNSPFGPGRPGWHIEDTAITQHFFGPQYDIHGGGIDLIFPHHECEIAQQEAASGKKPFVRYWVHSGFVNIKGEKMSKSLGNIIPASLVLEKYSPELIRFTLLSVHYRSPVDYSDKIFKTAKNALEKIYEFSERLEKYKPKDEKKECKVIKNQIKSFFLSMDDDFNTPKAFAAFFNVIKKANLKIDKNTLSKKDIKNIKKFFSDFEDIFKIKTKKTKTQKIPDDIKQLLKARQKAREEKNWNESDKIRDALLKRGWQVQDTKDGQIIKKI